MGALQMGLGAFASVMVSLFSEHSIIPMPLVMTVAALTGLLALWIGRRFIQTEVEASAEDTVMVH